MAWGGEASREGGNEQGKTTDSGNELYTKTRRCGFEPTPPRALYIQQQQWLPAQH